MYRFCTLLLVAFSAVAHAQPPAAGYNRISLSYTPLRFFNSLYLKEDNVAPAMVEAANTISHSVGLDIDHVTVRGIILNAGLKYGVRQHSLTLSRYNPYGLSTSFAGGHMYKTLYYLSPSVSAGYRLPLSRNWVLSGRAGLSLTLFSTENESTNRWTAVTSMDSTGAFIAEQKISTTARFGNSKYTDSTGNIYRRSRNHILSYLVYIGAEKTINDILIKNISFGVEAGCTTAWNKMNNGIDVEYSVRTNVPGSLIINRDQYIDRNIYLGLRIAVGLWY